MTKAVFWDFDGTLTVHKPVWTASVHKALTLVEPHCSIGIEAVRPLMQTGFTWHAPQVCYTDKLDRNCWWADLERHIRSAYADLGVDAGIAAEAASLVRGLVLDKSNFILHEDALAALAACKSAGFHNIIVSNNFPELPETAEALGLSPLLSGCVVSALVGYEKPRREIFEIALDLAGRPELCFMVGDNPVADIQGAQGAGIPAILVHNTAESKADYVCETLTEVCNIIISAV